MKQRVLFSGIAFSINAIEYWNPVNGSLLMVPSYSKNRNLSIVPKVWWNKTWHIVTNFTKFTMENVALNNLNYQILLDMYVPLIKKLRGKFLEFEIQEMKPEKGSISYKEAIASLESQGISNPTVPEILTEMGFTVGELTGWFDDSKGSEYNQSMFIKKRRQDTPKYGECFMDQRFYVISSSKKRAIFTNGRVYIVDTPLYGHALYIFDDYNSALEWAENKIPFKEAKEKALLRVVHTKGWKALIAEALRGW